MNRQNWIVTEKSARPAGNPDECFYCGRKIGEEHEEDCVIRKRSVVVEFTVTMVRKEPEYWDEDDIEFHYNESSWCADNFVDDLVERNEKMGCCCFITEAKYIREATQEDENHFGMVFVNDFES